MRNLRFMIDARRCNLQITIHDCLIDDLLLTTICDSQFAFVIHNLQYAIDYDFRTDFSL